ncbi:hypothetical protein OIV83_005722 [Microbotryomycetes sp. JL201]|nr:hypothetical protein OIV83_005722 [Microbotryomycetes sp. JL201]
MSILEQDPVPCFLNDEPWTATGSYKVQDPHDSSKTLHSVASVKVDDVEKVIQVADKAAKQWRKTPIVQRRDIFLKAAKLLRERIPKYAPIEFGETTSSEGWSGFEMTLAAESIEEAAAVATSALRGEIASTGPEQRAFIKRCPYNIVLGISPWNAPCTLAQRSVVQPILAGNAAILKTSEMSPRTHLILAELFKDAGLPAGVLSVVHVDPKDAPAVVEAFIAHPAVGKVNFTGSTRVGSVIAQMCGKHIKPVVLELGGKAPLIVMADADLDHAVNSVMFGGWFHSGQICMATQTVIVHETIADEFTARVAKETERLSAAAQGAPLRGLFTEASAKRVKDIVDDAVSKGAQVAAGKFDIKGNIVQPIMLDKVNETMKIYREEMFSPVFSIVKFKTEEEAIRIANDHEYGLAASVYTKDIAAGLRLADEIDSGMVHINGSTVHDSAQMPHGGWKRSGFGRFQGVEGIREFTQIKVVTINEPHPYPIYQTLRMNCTRASFTPRVVSSSIELSGITTRSTTTYMLEYNPKDGIKTWEAGLSGQEGFVEVQIGQTQSAERRVMQPTTKRAHASEQVHYYTFDLPEPTTGTSLTVTLHRTTTHDTRADPPALPQNADAIIMKYSADLLFPLAAMSPSERENISEYKVKVKAPTPRIGDVVAPSGFDGAHTKGGATVTFTANESLGAMSGPRVATVQYVQPSAIASIKTLDRIVEVSHWGAVMAVQDNVDLINAGPELMGQFSRLDFQRATMQRRAGNLAITSVQIALPPNVQRPYYYDIVGNVSTSRFRPSVSPHQAVLPSQRKAKSTAASLLDLVPRFPLMGGWNYTFTIGYDAPLSDYEKKRKNGEYVLGVPFLTPIKDVAVDSVKLEIRLPEGASNIRVHPPFTVSTELGQLARSYLDTTGRPTIVLRKQNCSDRHGGLVIIEYTLSSFSDYVRKPLAVAACSFFAFGIIFFSKRIDLSIERAAGTRPSKLKIQ